VNPEPIDFGRSSRPCIACGQTHGSIGERINCLEATVVALRQKLAEKPR
jgi:hypothetical protein